MSETLAKVIMKACAYMAKDRYASPNKMKRDLERALSKLSDAARCESLTALNTRTETAVQRTYSLLVANQSKKADNQWA